MKYRATFDLARMLLALVGLGISSAGFPQNAKAVYEIWVTGSPDLELCVGDIWLKGEYKSCGSLPARIVVSIEDSRWRLGYAFKSASVFDSNRIGAELSSEEAHALQADVTGWINQTYPKEFGFLTSLDSIVTEFCLQKKGQTVESGYVKALPLGPDQPKQRVHEVAIGDHFTSKAAPIKMLFRSPNDELVLDIALVWGFAHSALRDNIRAKVVLKTPTNLHIWRDSATRKPSPFEFIHGRFANEYYLSSNVYRFPVEGRMFENPAGAIVDCLLMVYRPEDSGFFASAKLEFDITSEQFQDALGGERVRMWVKDERGYRVALLTLSKRKQ